MLSVRHGGIVRRRLRKEAASAAAEGRAKIPDSHFSFPPTPAGLAAYPSDSDYFRVIPTNSDFTKRTRRGRPFTQLHFSPTRSKFFQGFLPRISRITRMKAALSESISHPCHPCHPWFKFFGCGSAALCSLWSSHLWLRRIALGLLGLFAAIQAKCPSMNHLRQKTSIPDQAKSNQIKVFLTLPANNGSTTAPFANSFHFAFCILHSAFPAPRHSMTPPLHSAIS